LKANEPPPLLNSFKCGSPDLRTTIHHIEALQTRATNVARSSPCHGPRHWRDVARVGMALHAAAVDSDLDVLLLFAAAHDTQRLSEHSDPEHGLRASNVVREMQAMGELPLAKAQLDALVVALTLHNVGATTKNATIACCWDADRLTLWRVGIVPDPNFLSTEMARENDDSFIGLGKHIVTGDDCSWEKIVEGYARNTAEARAATTRLNSPRPATPGERLATHVEENRRRTRVLRSNSLLPWFD
jgi:uncharacterized protein